MVNAEVQKVFLFLVSSGVLSCVGHGVSQKTSPSHELAHNTERSIIINETSDVLTLYNFVIESTDLQRDRGALQTFWRTNYGYRMYENDSMSVALRDRAFLHITRRGKSSIVYNVYNMVNATLEFELQLREDGAWVDIEPSKEYEDQYKTIVRDIRTRMLRYEKEF